MAFADEIAEKRKQQQQVAQAGALHAENVNAVKDSGGDIISALLGVNDGPKDVKVLNDNLASKDDIDSVIGQLKNIHLTNLLEANKPTTNQPVIHITDSAGMVGSTVGELGDKLMTQLTAMAGDDTNARLLSQLKDSLDALNTARQGDTTGMVNAVKDLKKVVQALDVNPQVHVDAPKVTVQPTPIDLKPLQDMLEKYMATDDGSDTVDLGCFRAQDLRNDGNIQYIGFVNPEGNWYIIENDVKGNSMRYVFGKSDYTNAWDTAGSHTYTLMNEAIHALSA